MFQAKLPHKFQLAIPKAFLEDLHLEAVQQFTLVARGSVIELILLRTVKMQEACYRLVRMRTLQDIGDRLDREFS